jgi:hypothetical protein
MDVTIRNRRDGVVELAPKHAPTDLVHRLLLAGTILLASLSLFVSGEMPPEVLAAIAVACLAGDVVLGVRALALRMLHPAAQVLELARCRPHRR